MSVFVDPRKVGGRYYSGHFRREYEVISIRGPVVTLKWEDGVQGCRVLPWDMLNDRVISQPKVTA